MTIKKKEIKQKQSASKIKNMEQQTYHPDNMSAPERDPRLESFNRPLVWRWCWELSKYHPSAGRHVKTSWEAFLVELGTLANGYILREVTPDLIQDIVWEQATEKKLKDHLFPKLTAEQYTEKPLEESELSLLKSLLSFMLSDWSSNNPEPIVEETQIQSCHSSSDS